MPKRELVTRSTPTTGADRAAVWLFFVLAVGYPLFIVICRMLT